MIIVPAVTARGIARNVRSMLVMSVALAVLPTGVATSVASWAQRFPTADATLLAPSLVPVAVQVNGRTRGLVDLAPDAEEGDAVQAVRGVAAVRQVLEGAPLRRVVYVPGRIINLVTG